MDYSRFLADTPQSSPIPGKSMVKNNAGGYTFEVSNWQRLDRFLFLGTEGGSYYVSEQTLTVDNVSTVIKCVKEDGIRVVDRLLEVSLNGVAFKKEPTLFVLSLVATYGNQEAKNASYQAIPKICNIGTHLFTFCKYVNTLRGWSRGLRKGVSSYYLSKSLDSLAYDLIKYKARNGWSHKDVLRLAHVNPSGDDVSKVLKYAAHEYDETIKYHPLIDAAESLSSCLVKQACKVIVDHKLPREVVPTEFLNHKEIWEALFVDMPLMALIRNLGKMTSVGLFQSSLDKYVKSAVAKICNKDILKKARVHPIQILLALHTYSKGRGIKGALTWNVVQGLVDALDEAFYLSFSNVEPTKHNYLLGLDVSGSMNSPVMGSVLTSREVSAAMALITKRTEPNCEIMGFSGGFIPLKISHKDRLNTVINNISRLPFDRTDCAVPMLWALKNKIPVDVFGIYTDNETWSGRTHPVQALNKYRDKFPGAKLFVQATAATAFSIADPNDPGMLDIAGFDASVPEVIKCFVVLK